MAINYATARALVFADLNAQTLRPLISVRAFSIAGELYNLAGNGTIVRAFYRENIGLDFRFRTADWHTSEGRNLKEKIRRVVGNRRHGRVRDDRFFESAETDLRATLVDYHRSDY